MINTWHTFVPGKDFHSVDLYKNICETLIDEGTLVIVREIGDGNTSYKWKIKGDKNKIVIKGNPGQILKIIVKDKDNSKSEYAA